MEMRQVSTLCLLYQHPRILLGMKKRGFGTGRWNGFGGKLHDGELIEDAAKREMLEESGVVVERLEQRGVLEFRFIQKPGEVLEVHVFSAQEYKGDPHETEEMEPRWFDVAEIPYNDMWPDDTYWLPLFLEGKRFRGSFLFGENDVILEKDLEVIG